MAMDAATDKEVIVHKGLCQVGGKDYEILVYSCNGRHFAKTVFAPEDIIISDGRTVDEVLSRHQRLLPLAINSRQILRDFRRVLQS